MKKTFYPSVALALTFVLCGPLESAEAGLAKRAADALLEAAQQVSHYMKRKKPKKTPPDLPDGPSTGRPRTGGPDIPVTTPTPPARPKPAIDPADAWKEGLPESAVNAAEMAGLSKAEIDLLRKANGLEPLEEAAADLLTVEKGKPIFGPRPNPGEPQYVLHGLTETSMKEMEALQKSGALGREGHETFVNSDLPYGGLSGFKRAEGGSSTPPESTIVFVWETPPGYVPSADSKIIGHIGTVDGPLPLSEADAYVLMDGVLHPIDGPADEFLDHIALETVEYVDEYGDAYETTVIRPR